MPIIEFLLNIAGATVLLLFAVKMVQTGVEQAYGPSFRRVMMRSTCRYHAVFNGSYDPGFRALGFICAFL